MKRSFISTLVATIAAFLLFPSVVSAAQISFSAPATVSVGDTFSLDVLVDSSDRAFNAAEGIIFFPEDILQVVSIDTSPSATIFNFWLFLPTFSNEDGEVVFSGGTTRGVLGSKIKLLSITFRAKASGDALITAGDASVNASDGSGTNILNDITAARISVAAAPITVPEKKVTETPPEQITTPTPQTEKPTPEPVVEEERHVDDRYLGDPESWEALQEKGCSTLFLNCSLRFPVIADVSLIPREPVGYDILTSGTAAEGDHVHLLLTQNDIPYKEVTAITEDGGVWEALLTNISSYGTFKLSAWAENEDNTLRSEIFRWSDIKVYPPHTFSLFGYTIRWYVLLTALFGVLAGVIGMFALWYRPLRYNKRARRATIILFSVLVFAFTGMSIDVYFLNEQDRPLVVTHWKDTSVLCLSHSFIEMHDHGSAQLSIFIDGQPQLIPAEVGISQDCVADIHTHDNTGRLHLHLHGGEPKATLADFFAVAGEPVQRVGYTLSVTVNGEDYTDQVNSYKIKHGDEIVVRYTSIPSAE